MITLIKHALSATAEGDIEIAGWIRSRRDAKNFSFLEINDGSCLRNLQVIVDQEARGYAEVVHAMTGASVRVQGRLVVSPAAGQKWEIRATSVEIAGRADATYPLQKKGHTVEFLRSIAHLRPRSNLFGAVFRVRSRLAYAVHQFFQERDFVYVQTPIITASDCEGAGELFRVTTLERGGDKIGEAAFFGKPTYLTVSGQLEAETFACALSKVYTFGPTFRAENSNTSRHAAEFWMVEPEMAFCDLQGDMDLAEEFVKAMVRHALERCAEDLGLFARFVDKALIARLTLVAEQPFRRLPYAEAIAILKASGRTFEYPVTDGLSLQSEHERFLAEEHFRAPVIVFDQPRRAKPFYMRVNEDGTTVAAMD
ncbi:MAG: asparagine--tRNA ligase, partial [Verrucomicrobia bacterium]|nr:asparagine--tRNA ligase [Verrucomicrobiota bacterium]